jgi:UrcA family protein
MDLVQFLTIDCALPEIGHTGWFAAHLGGAFNAVSRHPQELIMSQAHAYKFKMFAGLAMAGMLLSGAACAADQPKGGVVISVQDLNMRAGGAKAKLRHRVWVAAYKVCSAADLGVPIGSDAFIECLRGAVRGVAGPVDALVARLDGNGQVASSASGQ